jgi:zinc transport system permease protein
MVWRRMAYFGDTLSHSAWLGVAIGLIAGININLSILLLCLAAALFMFFFQRNNNLGNDTLLGILAHSALALGMILLSFVDNSNISIESYLFGDILAVSNYDIMLMSTISAGILVVLIKIWQPLLSLSVHKELAQVEGVNVGLYSFLYLLMIASLIAVAIKVVGVLLITALMIIPAATARRFAHSPESMAIMAAIIGIMALLIGLLISLQWDIPTGPSIVVAAASLFLISLLLNEQR